MGILNKLFGSSGNSKEDKADNYFQKSSSNINDGELKLAIRNLNKAIELDPSNGLYFYNRGTVKKMIQDFEGAIQDLTSSIDLETKDIKFNFIKEAYFNRAMSKFHLQDLTGAKKDNEKARELGYDLIQVNQLEEYIEEVKDIGYDVFMKEWE
jgi:tetratricopeptide (TPR) repeat protein